MSRYVAIGHANNGRRPSQPIASGRQVSGAENARADVRGLANPAPARATGLAWAATIANHTLDFFPLLLAAILACFWGRGDYYD